MFRRILRSLVVGCALAVSLAATVPTAPTAQAAANRPFLTSDGTSLRMGNKRIVLRGFTFYPADDGGSHAWVTPQFQNYLVSNVFTVASETRSNLYRPTDQFDNGTKDNWDNAQVWANMDYLIAAAKRQGRWVLLDLSFMSHVLTAHGENPMDPTLWYPMIDAISKKYANEPTIAAVSFLGEPQYPTTAAQLATLKTFYTDLINRWRLHDRNHLLMLGGLTHLIYGVPNWWESLELIPGVSLVGFKTYSLNDEKYQPTVDAFAKAHHLLLADEEFGEPQYMGDATWSGQVYNGLKVSRADFFKWVYAHANADKWSMAIFWNSASEIRPTTYDVNPQTPAVWAVVKANAIK